ncbi:MAG: hypothetical protein CUN56_04775 [Phototrophicales bacterium]|nr:MAG: hypothetical protein CUN56_04775 [Phototrophicales bacterium]
MSFLICLSVNSFNLMYSRIKKGYAMNRHIRSILLGIFMMFLFSIQPMLPLSVTMAQDIGNDGLYDAVSLIWSEQITAVLADELMFDHMTQIDDWVFGVVTMPGSQDHGEPISRYFIGYYDNGWNVALRYTSNFDSLMDASPVGLIPENIRNIFVTANALGSVSLSLPFPVGQTWTLSGGPHAADGNASNPWNALDFTYPGSGAITAAADGVVSLPCANYIVIDHGSGWQTTYYHAANIQVSHGQTVSRGQVLGYISAQSGCGGSATGAHQHFTTRLNGAPYPVNQANIGGWTGENGATQYTGCLRRISDGYRVCQGGQITNNGASGTAPVATPDLNLVRNYTFQNEFTNWERYGDVEWAIYADSDGDRYLATKRATGGSGGSIVQRLNVSVPDGGTVEVVINISNSSPVTKIPDVVLRDANSWNNAIKCTFTLPAGADHHTFIMRGSAQNFNNLILEIFPNPPDGIPDIWLDDVRVFYRDQHTVSRTECYGNSAPPISDAQGIGWDFTNGSLGSWVGQNHLSDGQPNGSNGFWWHIDGNDPYIVSASLTGIRGSDYPWIYVDMSTQSNVDCGQIFFRLAGQNEFRGNQYVQFNVNANGSWPGYWINMSQHSAWRSGLIRQLRLDPSCGYDPSAINGFAVRRIRLSRTGPNPPTATPVPTSTPVPPTATPVPTSTPVPPTATPTVSPVVIVEHPQSITVTEPQPATFRVTASGTNLTYQWYQFIGGNWTEIVGATESSLTFDPTGTVMSGLQVKVIVTGDGGVAESNVAILTVNPAEPSSAACQVLGAVNNGSTTVDISHIQAFAGRFGAQNGQPNYDPAFDLDSSGSIDISDIQRAASAFGQSCS